MKLTKFGVLISIFSVLLGIVYYCHVLFFNVDVVFYSAVWDGVLATFGAVLALVFLKFFKVFGRFEKMVLTALLLALSYIFAISIPTVIDRSLSFYILEKLQQRGGSIPYSDFDRLFREEYMKEDHLVDVRITEQQASGTITLQDGIVKLTGRGNFIATCSRFFRNNFLPKHRLLMGTYSDVLTHPFESVPNVKKESR